MLWLNLKLGFFSGSFFLWIRIGEYLYKGEKINNAILFIALSVLLILSLCMSYYTFIQIKKMTERDTRLKYISAAYSVIRNGNISKLRRLAMSNPIEASRYIKIKSIRV